MSGTLPTLLVIGMFAVGGFVLLNPEMRCNLLGLCGQGPPEPAVSEKEAKDDEEVLPPVNIINNTTNIKHRPNVINRYHQVPPYPAPPYPPPYHHHHHHKRPKVIVKPPIETAKKDCCECATQADGRARCRKGNKGPYTYGYRSAPYDVDYAAKLCAKANCKPKKPNLRDCNDVVCKTYPLLCPHCPPKQTSTSLFTTARLAI